MEQDLIKPDLGGEEKADEVCVLRADLWKLASRVAAAQIAIAAAMEEVRELERRLGVRLHRPTKDEAPTAGTVEASSVNNLR